MVSLSSIKSIIQSYTKPRILVKILLALTLLSMSLTAGIFARFTTGYSNMDNAHVAKFVSISMSETEQAYDSVIPGEEIDHQVYITVSGTSEAAFSTNLEISIPTVTVEDERHELFRFTPADCWSYDYQYELGDDNVYVYHHSQGSFTGTAAVFEGPVIVADYFDGMADDARIDVSASVRQIN